MTALGKLFRTTAFKLAAGLLAVFVVAAVLGLGYVVWQSGRVIQAQIASTVDAETSNLITRYDSSGFLGLLRDIEARARQPGSFLYLVTAPNGEPLIGNIGSLPPGIIDKTGSRETEYGPLNDQRSNASAHVKVSVLPNGFRLLVGRDLAERRRFAEVLAGQILGGLALVTLVGLAGGLVVARRVLVRLDEMTETSRTIMAGNLSRRLPMAGTGDEFDRLATATNQMLDRIGGLMVELRQVTDNVAHDLKTPLTRLRNRAEEALRTAKTEEEFRATLDQVIDESDDLIRTFNTMLLIARTESDTAVDIMAPVDAAELIESVAELYEPLAEDAEVELKVSAVAGARVRGNRELLGQALANLVDNALKYSTGDDGKGGPVEVAVEGERNVVRFIVADRGPGIPAEDRERALERFVRLESSRSRPGSGLGLSLANAVAIQHGGKLVLSDNRPGLRVTMELPRLTDNGAA
ncbi:sensor histidine kinase [Flaviflagellibacter deserti]|uniref:histidine kinase n=1 Tax=Flaviflagellibacter deserti TaxID=2267266 RepID=A0ABV9Z236_9HYPH